MRKITFSVSKYNVIPKIVVNAKYEKVLKTFSKILWVFSLVLTLIGVLFYKNILVLIIFILNSILASIYFLHYQYHNQFYAVCKEKGCNEKIFLRTINPPDTLRLRCKNDHIYEYKKEELKTFEVGIATGPEEKAYKSFRIYLE